VSVTFRPAANTTDADQVLLTFDQALATAPAGTAFTIYRANGSTQAGTGTPVINTANTSQVLVNFANGALANAVGVIVAENAVTATAEAAANRVDEEGAAGSTATAGRTAGRTAGPDLTGVSLAQGTDAFNNPSGFRATYTFDEDVALVNGTLFRLYQANGTSFTPSGCTVGDTEATDNTVTCTTVVAPAGATVSATIGSAVLGTVLQGAVGGVASESLTVGGASNGELNPEGAELTTGGTGTRTA
jgi:hypothetical protein